MAENYARILVVQSFRTGEGILFVQFRRQNRRALSCSLRVAEVHVVVVPYR